MRRIRCLIPPSTAILLAAIGASEAMATGASVTYYYTDPQGSVLATADENGNILSTVERRPYGTYATGLPVAGPGFTGHVDDPDSNLTYMQARYYDPSVGRFISIDPKPPSAGELGAFTRYIYVANNPMTNTDPDGRACVTTGGANGKGGCFVTPEERRLADKGDWKGYYETAGNKGGDPYAKRAGEVASETGATPFLSALTTITTLRLERSIEINTPDVPVKPLIVETKLENIREQLAQAHVAALDSAGASPSNPVQLQRETIAKFHEDVFRENGAGNVFGGKTWDNLPVPGLRKLYDWCPSPSCSQ